ncbi:MAG: SPOR domain-containing protein [Candidatus Rokubacteria bacterium]|nr:SPOR domain-containing protein [Candidatus Rokubacteria bacterium]
MAAPDDPEPYEDEAPRSIFAALWFRALIVILVVGVVAAVAVPYVLDVVNPPPAPKQVAAPVPRSTPSTAFPTVAPSPSPAPTPPTPAPVPPLSTTAPAAAPTAPKPVAPALQPSERQAPKPAAPAREAKATPTKPAPARTQTAAARGPYWVQVGAFRDQAAATRLAAKLRGENYKVEESVSSTAGGSAAGAPPPMAPTAADRYDVFVSGLAPAEINAKLSAKGLAAESVAGGVVVKPGLPLREAVALSKDLAAEGLKVQVRRAGGAAAAGAAPAPAPVAAGGETLHRVRVGSFPDRAAAAAVARELEAKGYKPFIARGGQ